jgi:signal transduction histidine kinase
VADPQHGLSVGDWIQLVLGTVFSALVVGIGGAMAWFSKTKAAMLTRIDMVEQVNNFQATEIAVLKANHEHLSEELTDIKETTRDTNRKLDDVLLTLKHGRV